MSPVLTSNDHGDSALRDAVVLAEIHLPDAARGVPASDLADLFFGQLGEVAPLAGATVRGSSLLRHVGDVVLLRSEEQMGGVHAVPNIAPVAHQEARRDRADMVFVRPPVSAHLALTDTEGPVPVGEAGSGPDPTPIVLDLDLGLETFDRFNSDKSHRIEKGTI
jgi:hypothetical protein